MAAKRTREEPITTILKRVGVNYTATTILSVEMLLGSGERKNVRKYAAASPPASKVQ